MHSLVSRNVYFLWFMLFFQYDAIERCIKWRRVTIKINVILKNKKIKILSFMYCSEWSQDGNYNWKNYRSNWHPDTGYDDNALANNLPMRTFGEGDYHSATMKLDFHNEDSNEECAHGLEIFYVRIFYITLFQ